MPKTAEHKANTEYRRAARRAEHTHSAREAYRQARTAKNAYRALNGGIR